MKQLHYDCGCSFDIDETQGLILGKPSIILDFENLPDCPLVWELLGSGRTKGVFQLESNLGRHWAKKLKPEKMEHLSALGSILRPGSLNSKNEEGVSMTELYCLRKNGIIPVEYFHPSLEPILKDSCGVLIYQEQILEIAKQLAGFTLQEADTLRKSVGKKLAELMAKVKLEFIAKAEKFGVVTKSEAETIFENIEKSQKYLFNKSHAWSYAVLGYETAYCKAHFPLQFFTNYLYYAKDKQDPMQEIKEVVTDAKSFGFEVVPPKFTKLKKHFSVDDNCIEIMFGLSDVSGIGEKNVDKMKANAAKIPTPITTWTWYEFLTLFSDLCTSTVVRSMIQVGAMRHLPHDRKWMLAEYEAYLELTKAEKVGIASLSQPIYKEKAKKERGVDGKLKSIRDADGEIIYEKVLDEDGQPIILDEPRPAQSLQEALTNILARPGVVSTRRRDKVQSILDLLKTPPTSVTDSPLWISKIEEEKLGISLTLAKISSSYTPNADTTILEYQKGKRAETFVIACEIADFREIKIKNGDHRGRPMAFLTVSDEGATMEDVVVFPDVYEEFGNRIFQGNTVEMTGQRDRKKGSFFVSSINQVG
jgi:DNA polymerase III alpha subunit